MDERVQEALDSFPLGAFRGFIYIIIFHLVSSIQKANLKANADF